MPIKMSLKPATNREPLEVYVLGLGNTRLADDGIGVHVVRRLAHDSETPPGLRAHDSGAFGFRLLSKLTKADAVLMVDAVYMGAPAGTTCLLEREELAQHVASGGRIGAHESGLVQLLTRARQQGYKPSRLALLAVQPQSLEWDEDLSPPVFKSLPMVCEEVVRTVLAWQQSAQTVSNIQSLVGFCAN